MLTCAKISVLALSTCLTLAASFRNLAMARGDWVTSPCVLYFSYKDVEDNFKVSTLPLHKVLTFESVGEILKCDHSNESNWGVLSCGTVYYAVQGGLTFECLGKILKCDHDSNESYWAVLSCGTVYYAVQGGSNFSVCGWNPKVWRIKWKLLSSTFLWYYIIIMHKVVLTQIKAT